MPDSFGFFIEHPLPPNEGRIDSEPDSRLDDEFHEVLELLLSAPQKLSRVPLLAPRLDGLKERRLLVAAERMHSRLGRGEALPDDYISQTLLECVEVEPDLVQLHFWLQEESTRAQVRLSMEIVLHALLSHSYIGVESESVATASEVLRAVQSLHALAYWAKPPLAVEAALNLRLPNPGEITADLAATLGDGPVDDATPVEPHPSAALLVELQRIRVAIRALDRFLSVGALRGRQLSDKPTVRQLTHGGIGARLANSLGVLADSVRRSEEVVTTTATPPPKIADLNDDALVQEIESILGETPVGGLSIAATKRELKRRGDELRTVLSSTAFSQFSSADAGREWDQLPALLSMADVSLPITIQPDAPESLTNVDIQGFSDHIIVERQVLRYEAADVVRIDPIRAGEAWLREHTEERERERTQASSQVIVSDSENEFGMSSRSDFERSARNELSTRLGVEGSIDAQYNGLTVKVQTHLGATYERTQQKVDESVQRTMREIAERSINRQREETLQSDVDRILERTREHTKRELQPAANDSNRIFQAVDEVSRLRAINRGRRLKLRCSIWNPGELLLKAHNAKNPSPSIPKPPKVSVYRDSRSLDDLSVTELRDLVEQLRSGALADEISDEPLRPHHITRDNYLAYAAQVGAVAAVPRFPEPITLNTGFSEIPTDSTTHGVPNTKLKVSIPAGYRPVYAGISGVHVPAAYDTGMAIMRGDKVTSVRKTGYLSVSCAGVSITFRGSRDKVNYLPAWLDLTEPRGTIHPASDGTLSSPTSAIAATMADDLPIDVGWYRAKLVSITVAVECEPTDLSVREWQVAAYDAIMTAYHEKVAEVQESHRIQQLAGPVDDEHPEVVRERIRTELKRGFIEAFLGVQLGGTDISVAGQLVPLDGGKQLGRLIQWIEQVLEWDYMTATMAEYYWSARLGWIEGLNRDLGNPDLDRATAAPLAIAEVTVAPEAAEAVLLFLRYQVLWDLSAVPLVAPSDRTILANLGIDTRWRDASPLLVSLSGDSRSGTITSITGALPDVRWLHGALIRIGNYEAQIASVTSDGAIVLKSKWTGPDQNSASFEAGPTILGEPQVIRTPTQHLWLRAKQELPDFETTNSP